MSKKWLRFTVVTALAWAVGACTAFTALTGPAELPPSAVTTKDGTVITLTDILFEFNEAILRPEGWELVSTIARYMQQHPETRAEVAGHTDNLGDSNYNRELSRRRAEAVRNVLRARGVEAARISTYNYGEDRPLADNDTPEGRRKNRRVEINLTASPAQTGNGPR